VKRIEFERNRVLILAILISAAWHIFWVAAVKVVAAPSKTGAVKFSKVSFLGPILNRAALELRIEPIERSPAEKRSLLWAQSAAAAGLDSLKRDSEEPETNDFYSAGEKGAPSLIKKAVSGPKLEPAFPAD
jgi:hypothetical protein